MGEADAAATPAPVGAATTPSPCPVIVWYYADPATGQPTGPYPEPSFAALARAGAMPLHTPVWRAGLEWKPLADHGPGVLGIPVATLRQAALAAKADAERRAGGGAAGEADEEATLAADAVSPPLPAVSSSPPPGERRFVEDGTAFEWDSRLHRFVEVDGEQKAAPKPNKRSAADVLERRGGGGGSKPAHPPSSSGWGGRAGGDDSAAPPPPPPARPPTAIYVTGLPLDTSEAEVAAAFSRCGLIRPARSDPTGRAPSVKLYRDAGSGALKGDATITFLRPPSVDLAITLLDGVPLRPGGSGQAGGQPGPPMSVGIAKFEMRGGAFDEGRAAAATAAAAPPPAKRARGGWKGGRGGGGGGRPAAPPANAAAALAAKALAWDGFDDEAPAEATTVVARWGDSGGDSALLASLIEGGKDVVSAFEVSLASVCGRVVGGEVGAGGRAVEGVRAFLGEPAGLVATIRFRTPEGAAAAVARLGGKPLTPDGPPVLSVELWDGVTGFRARPPKKVVAEAVVDKEKEEEGEEEDDQARLDRFGADLFGE